MRIGIDARFYGVVRQGLGRYCEQLVMHITRLDTHNDYVIFVLKGHAFANLPSHVRVVECSYRWYGFAEQLLWPFFLYRYQLDLMHFTSFNVPMLYRRKFVLTIHDLILIHHSSAHASTLHPLLYVAKRMLYQIVLRSAVARAQHIFAVSKFTADDLRKTLRTTTPISVTYLGFELLLHSGKESTGRSAVYVPNSPYFVYVGNAYPHKNLEFMLRTFIEWKQTHPEFVFVLVGNNDYFYTRLKKVFRDRNDIVWLENVTDTELSIVYRHAKAYVFPSLYEGFGIPPLEAMQFDIPVVASSASCLPEILGNAALYFDPNDSVSLASALERIVNDAELRNSLQLLGKQQLKKYSWVRMAEEVFQLYDMLEKQYTNTKTKSLNAPT